MADDDNNPGLLSRIWRSPLLAPVRGFVRWVNEDPRAPRAEQTNTELPNDTISRVDGRENVTLEPVTLSEADELQLRALAITNPELVAQRRLILETAERERLANLETQTVESQTVEGQTVEAQTVDAETLEVDEGALANFGVAPGNDTNVVTADLENNMTGADIAAGITAADLAHHEEVLASISQDRTLTEMERLAEQARLAGLAEVESYVAEPVNVTDATEGTSLASATITQEVLAPLAGATQVAENIVEHATEGGTAVVDDTIITENTENETDEEEPVTIAAPVTVTAQGAELITAPLETTLNTADLQTTIPSFELRGRQDEEETQVAVTDNTQEVITTGEAVTVEASTAELPAGVRVFPSLMESEREARLGLSGTFYPTRNNQDLRMVYSPTALTPDQVTLALSLDSQGLLPAVTAPVAGGERMQAVMPRLDVGSDISEALLTSLQVDASALENALQDGPIRLTPQRGPIGGELVSLYDREMMDGLRGPIGEGSVSGMINGRRSDPSTVEFLGATQAPEGLNWLVLGRDGVGTEAERQILSESILEGLRRSPFSGGSYMAATGGRDFGWRRDPMPAADVNDLDHDNNVTEAVPDVNDIDRDGNRTEARPDWHAGADLNPFDTSEAGKTVHATMPGVLLYAGTAGGYGNLVEIGAYDPVNDVTYVTRFGHLQSIAEMQQIFREGQESNTATYIPSGYPIGPMGRSGRVTGAHLHYETAVVPGNLFEWSHQRRLELQEDGRGRVDERLAGMIQQRINGNMRDPFEFLEGDLIENARAHGDGAFAGGVYPGRYYGVEGAGAEQSPVLMLAGLIDRLTGRQVTPVAYTPDGGQPLEGHGLNTTVFAFGPAPGGPSTP